MKLKLKHKSKPAPATDVRYGRMPTVARPKFTDSLKFPEDITELGSANCSELLGKYTLLWSYVNQDVSNLKVRQLKLQQREQLRLNQIFRENPAVNRLEKWRKDSVIAEDTYIEAIRSAMLTTNMQLETMNMYLANFDRYINALSRELTRKTHETSLHRA